jgi:hypothetical protein
MSGTHRWWIDMKTVEYWMWRYRNVETGRICRTMFPCSAEEASRLYPDAERIQGTMILRQVHDDDAGGHKTRCFSSQGVRVKPMSTEHVNRDTRTPNQGRI